MHLDLLPEQNTNNKPTCDFQDDDNQWTEQAVYFDRVVTLQRYHFMARMDKMNDYSEPQLFQHTHGMQVL